MKERSTPTCLACRRLLFTACLCWDEIQKKSFCCSSQLEERSAVAACAGQKLGRSVLKLIVLRAQASVLCLRQEH